jgi:hypothetical protein
MTCDTTAAVGSTPPALAGTQLAGMLAGWLEVSADLRVAQ